MTRLTRNSIALGFACVLSLSSGLCAAEGAPLDRPSLQSGDEALQAAAPIIQHVFVIVMENHDGSQIYGNTTNAPYINNTLIPSYAHATNFNDELPSLASEPHYLWLEAGTNAFSDHTFTTDSDPSGTNSTSSTAHLVTQIKNATSGVTWMTYQEGQNATTGSCPSPAAASTRPSTIHSSSSRTSPAIRLPRPTPTARRTASPTARSRRTWRRTTWRATSSSLRICATTCTGLPAARTATRSGPGMTG